jgi:hypothetical protein
MIPDKLIQSLDDLDLKIGNTIRKVETQRNYMHAHRPDNPELLKVRAVIEWLEQQHVQLVTNINWLTGETEKEVVPIRDPLDSGHGRNLSVGNPKGQKGYRN